MTTAAAPRRIGEDELDALVIGGGVVGAPEVAANASRLAAPDLPGGIPA